MTGSYNKRRGISPTPFIVSKYGRWRYFVIQGLKESKYLLEFSLKEGYIAREEYQEVIQLAEEIGAMLWSIMRKL